MSTAVENWSTQQLAEFLAVITSFADEQSATLGAVERAAEALDAEVAAIVRDDAVTASIGFPGGAPPVADLLAVADGALDRLDVPGVGPCAAVSVPLEGEAGGSLVLARAGEDGFGPEERHLLRAMGRVLSLATQLLSTISEERALRKRSEAQAAENAALLAELRERQALLDRLAGIQRAIVQRADLEGLLQAVVEGARELIGDEVVTLRLIDPADATRTELVAHVGLPAALGEELRHGSVGEGASGRAIRERRLVVIEEYPTSPAALPSLATELQAVMAMPVHRNGAVCGSLVVGTRSEGRTYSSSERELLLAFAEHASLALTDAGNFAQAIHQAAHDPLTDLANREHFAIKLAAALTWAQERGTEVAVLFLDLDGFKTVNDTLGHGAGDQLLQAVASRLQAAVKEADTAARFGGDEFAVLLSFQGDLSSTPTEVAERLLATLMAPFDVGGRQVSLTASIGVATGNEPGADLVHNADLAMYHAKASGRARVAVFEQDMHTAVVRRVALEEDLRWAVERDELVLHYQPIVELRTGGLVGIEALLRWRHPTRGLLAAAEFVSVAEDSGLIVPAGRWALSEACRQAVAWKALHPTLVMAVNLSGVQLAQPAFPDEVSALLNESGLDSRSLILEVTEAALIEDVEATRDRLRELKRLGVRVAVDDFGTGYSSLQHLTGLPIDVLKLAKSFVDGVAGGSDEEALARSVVDLGGRLELCLVAEGVERAEQVEALCRLGCKLGQGYHLARPMDGGAIRRLLEGRDSLVNGAAPATLATAALPATGERGRPGDAGDRSANRG